MNDEETKQAILAKGITAKDGLLWRKGEIIGVMEADAIALEHGLLYAERVVTLLGGNRSTDGK